jgi:hypothetical protein
MKHHLRPTVYRAAGTLLLVTLLGGACGKPGSGSAAGPSKEVEAKLAAIRQAGEPVTLAECDAWYARTPSAENAARLYTEAFAALVTTDDKAPTFLESNRKALELVHRAASETPCRFPVDLKEGMRAPLPHLAKIKPCAQLLRQEAIANAGKGRTDLATRALLDGLRLARCLEAEPTLVAQLVRIAAEQIAASGLEQALSLKPFSAAELAQLQAAFHAADAASADALVRGFVGERCMGVSVFNGSPKELSALLETMKPGAAMPDAEAYWKGPAKQADFIFYLDEMADFIASAKAPSPETQQAAEQRTARVEGAVGKGYVISGMLLPGLQKTLNRAAAASGALRTAEAALAIERYRTAHQMMLPQGLAALAPQYLSAVPADPFDGQALRFKRTLPKGYVVYCVGPDRHDDGGTPKKVGATSDANADLTFSVQR